MQKFCKDCIHLKKFYCTRKPVRINLVTGDKVFPTPEEERDLSTWLGGCGQKGKYFVKRND